MSGIFIKNHKDQNKMYHPFSAKKDENYKTIITIQEKYPLKMKV